MTEPNGGWRFSVFGGILVLIVLCGALVAVLFWVGALLRDRQDALAQAVLEQEQQEQAELDRQEREREEQEKKAKEERPYLECVDKLKKLTAAVEDYKLRNNVYPDALQALLEPQPRGGPTVFTKRDSIVDPWGKPFNYDTSGPHTTGRRPDIWTNSPRGILGNWPPPLVKP